MRGVTIESTRRRTTTLTGTALLSTLVIVFDYTLKYSGLKIPFPWYPNLKFDFTGIPVVLSLLMYGSLSALTTSLIAGLAIFTRSGNVLSSSIKSIAELTTVAGMALGFYLTDRDGSGMIGNRKVAIFVGLIGRVASMALVNLVVLPKFYGVPIEITYGLQPIIGAFNMIQGSITILLGFLLNDAIKKRLPNL